MDLRTGCRAGGIFIRVTALLWRVDEISDARQAEGCPTLMRQAEDRPSPQTSVRKKRGYSETHNHAMAQYRRSGSTLPGFQFRTLVLHSLTASLLFDGQYGSGHPDPDFR